MRIARSAVKAAILSVLQARAALIAVNTDTGSPPQITRSFETVWQARERIVIGEVNGELSVPTMRAGAKTTVDDFEISIYFVVAVPGYTVEQAEDRCTALVEDVVEALSLTANLAGAVTGTLQAIASRLDGPNDDLGDVADVNTRVSAATLTVACTVRTHPT